MEWLIHGGSYFRNFTVVHLYLLYDDIYSMRIWITSMISSKYAHRRPQVDQLLLSRVIDVKYGCFTLSFRNYEADAVWLSLRSILGRARRIREWEERTPLLFSHRASSTFPLSPWYVAELTVKWRSTDRLLSPMRAYCVLGYLLLEPRWSPHPPS